MGLGEGVTVLSHVLLKNPTSFPPSTLPDAVTTQRLRVLVRAVVDRARSPNDCTAARSEAGRADPSGVLAGTTGARDRCRRTASSATESECQRIRRSCTVEPACPPVGERTGVRKHLDGSRHDCDTQRPLLPPLRSCCEPAACRREDQPCAHRVRTAVKRPHPGAMPSRRTTHVVHVKSNDASPRVVRERSQMAHRVSTGSRPV